jgi:hypothetical protein
VQAATRVNAEQALYGAFSVNADFDRAPVIFLVGQQSGPRELAIGRATLISIVLLLFF